MRNSGKFQHSLWLIRTRCQGMNNFMIVVRPCKISVSIMFFFYFVLLRNNKGKGKILRVLHDNKTRAPNVKIGFVQCVSAHDEECKQAVAAELTPRVFVRLCTNGSTCALYAKTVPKLLTPKQKISKMNIGVDIFEWNRPRFGSIRHGGCLFVTNHGFLNTVPKQNADIDALEGVQTRHGRKKWKRANQTLIFVWSFSFWREGIVYAHWASEGQTRRFYLVIANEWMDEDTRICGRTKGYDLKACGRGKGKSDGGS